MLTIGFAEIVVRSALACNHVIAVLEKTHPSISDLDSHAAPDNRDAKWLDTHIFNSEQLEG